MKTGSDNVRYDTRAQRNAEHYQRLTLPDLPVEAQASAGRQGVCKITVDNADGTYECTEVIWDSSTSTWDLLAAGGGFVGEECQDFLESTAGSVDDIVRFWTDISEEGELTIFIDVGAAGGGGGTHTLLDGSTHTDTVSNTVEEGAVTFGNATSKWDMTHLVHIDPDNFNVGIGTYWEDGSNVTYDLHLLDTDPVMAIESKAGTGDGTATLIFTTDSGMGYDNIWRFQQVSEGEQLDLAFASSTTGGITYVSYTLDSSLGQHKITFNPNDDDVEFWMLDSSGNPVIDIQDKYIGFFDTTPVSQRTKASHNNWASLSDVVDALVELGLFDTA